jgi:hypothetical protein
LKRAKLQHVLGFQKMQLLSEIKFIVTEVFSSAFGTLGFQVQLMGCKIYLHQIYFKIKVS